MDKRIMTPEQLAAIRARAEAATKGVLTIDRYNHGGGRFSLDHAKGRQLVADFYEIGDREFYAEARADIPALLDHIERLQGQVEALAELVREAYQSGCSDAADYECGYGGGVSTRKYFPTSPPSSTARATKARGHDLFRTRNHRLARL